MNSIKTREIKTKHGIIIYRDSLIVSECSLSLAPMALEISASLSPLGCEPILEEGGDVKLMFKFTKMKRLCIYLVDDFPYEKLLSSSFDEVLNDRGESDGRYILSTYDHVFDVTGKCEIFY